MKSEFAHRAGLTFGQAEGVEDLPRQLQQGEISDQLTATLWALIYDSFNDSVHHDRTGYGGVPWIIDPWRTILQIWHVGWEYKLADEFSVNASDRLKHLKSIVTTKDHVKLFNFIQFLIQRRDCPHKLDIQIAEALKFTRAAYRIVERLVVPVASEEEASAIQQALEVAGQAPAGGPRSHLRGAARQLTAGDWAASVRESIHAVEAAAKSIEPEAGTLGPAISRLQASIGLNPVLGAAFNKLYGYSCDEKGVRHALVFEGEASVGEREAIFMFGACASFVGYLLSATRT